MNDYWQFLVNAIDWNTFTLFHKIVLIMGIPAYILLFIIMPYCLIVPFLNRLLQNFNVKNIILFLLVVIFSNSPLLGIFVLPYFL